MNEIDNEGPLKLMTSCSMPLRDLHRNDASGGFNYAVLSTRFRLRARAGLSLPIISRN